MSEQTRVASDPLNQNPPTQLFPLDTRLQVGD
jgi:hypothetical protein